MTVVHQDMVLTVQVPKLVAVFYGKHRNRYSAVEGLVPLVTSVRAVRLIVREGAPDPVAVQVDAFIPERERRGIEGRATKWITPEVYRCIAYIRENRKSLAAFLASGDLEWRLAGGA